MASKTTVACCLVVALFVFLETAESQNKTCDALVDVTYLIDMSSSWYSKDFEYEKEFLQSQIRALLPSQNEVRIRVMFYSSEIVAIQSSAKKDWAFLYGFYPYGSYEDKDWLESIAPTARQGPIGDNVRQALLEASIHGPETSCRKEHGARRVVVVVVDAVDYTSLDDSMFRSILNIRGVEVLALAIRYPFGLESYLNLDGNDRIIRLGDASYLIYEEIHTMVVDELCKETQEMRLYREKMSASFQKKYTYNKHTYYLSKEYFDNLTQVHDTCKSADGYLAVMNNQQEFDAMKQYFTDNNPGHAFIIDGTDAVTEGKWTLLSGAPLPFVDWLPNNPRQESDDCLAVSSVSFKMFDTLCDGLPGRFPYLFLCEVSEESDILDGFTCSHSLY